MPLAAGRQSRRGSAIVEFAMVSVFLVPLLLSAGSTRVSATGAASRREVNAILVLDRSSSLQSANVCGAMKSAAIGFVDKFSNGRDRLGLITFGGSYLTAFSPGANFKSANPGRSSLIRQITCSGNTGTAQALYQAYQQLRAINEPGALNRIVFFTDTNANETLISNKQNC